MKSDCPFIDCFGGDGVEKCVYYEEGAGYCDGININPANGDAWCHEKITLGIHHEEQHHQEDGAM